jgi:hypothetical protein
MNPLLKMGRHALGDPTANKTAAWFSFHHLLRLLQQF